MSGANEKKFPLWKLALSALKPNEGLSAALQLLAVTVIATQVSGLSSTQQNEIKTAVEDKLQPLIDTIERDKAFASIMAIAGVIVGILGLAGTIISLLAAGQRC